MNRRILIFFFMLGAGAPLLWAGQNPSQTATDKKPELVAPRNLTIDDLFQLKRVEDPQLSPEGKSVAYTVITLNLKEDKTEKQVWMAPTAGGEAIPMTAKGVSSWSPRWSPDGKFLAFLSARGEGKMGAPKAQVWALYRQGGEAQQLTETLQGVQAFEWSPSGDRLVLVLQDPSPEELAAEQEADKSKPKTPRPWVIDRLQFKRDGVGYLDRRRMRLHVYDRATRKMIQITSGDFDDTEPAWSPDGRLIAFTSNRTENPDANFNSDIWVVAADNPDKGKTLLRLTSNPGSDHSPTWSPDGRWVAYASQTEPKLFDYATHHLAVVPGAGGPERILTKELDRNVIAPRFAPDSQSVYCLIENDGTQPLVRVPLARGEVTHSVSGRVSVGAFSIGKEGTIAALVGKPELPQEVFLLEAGQLRRLTTTNDVLMAQIRLGEVEYVRFKSRDGTEIRGYLYRPPAFKLELRYPTLLRIHGGPVSQYDARFNFEAHLFAANGYVVLLPNPRGSSGYGQEFARAIFADWGTKDYEDVTAFVDYAVAKGIADPARLAVGGWSYGGILTDHVLVRTDRFKAAISGASEFLYVTNYGHDHYQREWEYELGLPWKNRVLWEKLSPFNSVERIVTPTLIIGGEKDWNVPIINSEQMYQSLKRLGRTTQLVVYPGEFHAIEKPSYLKDRLERYLGWYGQYVKGEAPAVPQQKPTN